MENVVKKALPFRVDFAELFSLQLQDRFRWPYPVSDEKEIIVRGCVYIARRGVLSTDLSAFGSHVNDFCKLFRLSRSELIMHPNTALSVIAYSDRIDEQFSLI